MTNLFEGQAVSLAEMLAAREERALIQQILLQDTTATLVSATLAIPGPVKHSERFTHVFLTVQQQIDQALADCWPKASMYQSKVTGAAYYVLVPLAPQLVKKRMIQIEETHPYGRLVDLDVLWQQAGIMQTLHREELGYPKRRCLVCQEEAKLCARARVHSLAALQEAINQRVMKEEVLRYDEANSFDGNGVT